MQGVVKRWGNSAAVRIPAAVLEAAQVRLDQSVDVREEGGRIIIEPLRPARYDIDDLIAGITDENRHDPIDMGEPVGGEISGSEPGSRAAQEGSGTKQRQAVTQLQLFGKLSP